MQGGRGGRDPFFDFGDPFAGFGGSGSSGPPRSLMPFPTMGGSLFSNFPSMGRDPFNDPFFTNPFGGMSSFFGPIGNPFPNMQPSGFGGPQGADPRNSRGPIIEEINSDDENEEEKQEKGKNPRKHGRSNNESQLVYPEDEVGGRKSKHLQSRNEFSGFRQISAQPQTQSFCFQSSTVSYGGPGGMYYTSSSTRRTGSDGVTFEENKEANSATREAKHRVSRGLHNKGHTLMRKLNSDGKVDSMQTLHNLNEDELSGFEEAWQGKAQNYLPGWSGGVGASSGGQIQQGRQGGWALPSTEHHNHTGPMSVGRDGAGSSAMKEGAKTKTKTDKSDRNAHRPARG